MNWYFSLPGILFSIIGITMIRTFLENFSNPEPFVGFTSILTILGYFAFYASLILSIGIIVGLILGESFHKHISRAIFFSPIIWIAPIIDLIISGGACMAYLGSTGGALVKDFLLFFGDLPQFCGITIGMRIEIGIILLGTAIYIWKKTRSIWKAFLGTVLVYSTIFLHLSLTGIIGSLGNMTADISQSFHILFSQSLLATVHTITDSVGNFRFMEQLAILSSRIFWVSTFIFTIWLVARDYRQKFVAWMRNARMVRVAYYALLAIGGMVLAAKNPGFYMFGSWIDLMGYAIFFICIALSFWFAVAVNDIEDEPIDRISNANRPLITGKLSLQDLKVVAQLTACFITVGVVLINWNVAIIFLVFQVAYSVYSLPPLKMKRHFVFSSFLVGTAGLTMFLAGYFLVSPDQTFATLPYGIITAIFITLAIISNTKDFKDVAGDKAEGIQTMPVVFGTRRAGKYLTFTLILWILFLGFIYTNIWIAACALPWIILDVILRKRIPEYVRFLIVFGEIILLLVVL